MKMILCALLLFTACPAFAEGEKTCPDYVQPVCNMAERPVIVVQANGCPKPECPKFNADDEEFQPMGCPTLVTPVCVGSEVLVHHTDPNRCPYSTCEMKKGKN